MRCDFFEKASSASRTWLLRPSVANRTRYDLVRAVGSDLVDLACEVTCCDQAVVRDLAHGRGDGGGIVVAEVVEEVADG